MPEEQEEEQEEQEEQEQGGQEQEEQDQEEGSVVKGSAKAVQERGRSGGGQSAGTAVEIVGLGLGVAGGVDEVMQLVWKHTRWLTPEAVNLGRGYHLQIVRRQMDELQARRDEMHGRRREAAEKKKARRERGAEGWKAVQLCRRCKGGANTRRATIALLVVGALLWGCFGFVVARGQAGSSVAVALAAAAAVATVLSVARMAMSGWCHRAPLHTPGVIEMQTI
jgi:hypothetical protein